MEINQALELSQRKYLIKKDRKKGGYTLKTTGQDGADQFQADALHVASGSKESLNETLKKLFDLRNGIKQKVTVKK